jgi:ferritin-like protein
MSSESLHEAADALSTQTKDMHRAIVSLIEELEAIDWYQQRAEACHDDELKGVLVHNKREEIEHAMMVLEWIRRHSPTFAENVGTYIESSGPILDVEKQTAAGGASPATSESASLGIGSLKEGG